MSIVLYSGLPGSGKSYAVVEHVILPAAKSGRTIVTNIPLVEDFDLEFGCVVLPLPSEPSGWLDLPAGAVIVIDEAWRLFPSGLQANKLPEALRESFSMHRHKLDDEGRSQQIVLVSQKASGLCRFARDLVEQHFLITKLTVVGASRKFRVDVFEGIETETRKAQHIRQIFGSYSESVWRYYKSHTGSESGVEGMPDEKSIDQRGSVWRSKTILLGVPFAIAFLVFGGLRIYSLFSGGDESAPAGAAKSTPAVGAAVKSEVSVKGANTGAVSTGWRIAAEISEVDGSRHIVVLEDASGRHRRISGKVCIREDGELSCDVDGARVTYYSGVVKSGGGEKGLSIPMPAALKKEG